jgi:AhpD family alkylhydroperoxidase
MPRLTPKSRADLPKHLHPLWDKMLGYGDFADQAGVMALRLPIFEKTWGMLVELADEAHMPKRYTELAIVTVSKLNECEYCVAHHTPKLAIQGVSPEGAETILDYENHPELDEVDKLVVEYAIAVTNNWNRTRDEIFGRLKQHFTEPQIMELTWRTALCGAFNRFNDILQLEDHASEAEAGVGAAAE